MTAIDAIAVIARRAAPKQSRGARKPGKAIATRT